MNNRKKTASKKIFISWSGDNSKEIARTLKVALEQKIFAGSGLECFVSDEEIKAGEDWWAKIKKELRSCNIGLAVITKENIHAPWLYFETGVIVAREKRLIPLLFNCDYRLLEHTPLQIKQMKNFHDAKQFRDMIFQINSLFGNLQTNESALNSLVNEGYLWLKKELEHITKRLKDMRIFNEKYVYPENVKTVSKKTIFVSSPMAAVNDETYNKLSSFIESIKQCLLDIGFNEVISPVFNKKNKENFDGPAAAIDENYPKLKSVESMLVIVPAASCFTYSSSIWVDIGYCLALTKNIVIFHEDKLPYMLEAAGSYISHVHTYQYKSDPNSDDPYRSIREIIVKSKMALFMPSNSMEDLE